MPLIKLLLLLLFLLRTALLHRRRRPHQWMRLLDRRPRGLRLRWTKFAVRRLRVAIFLRLRAPILRRRSSLLLVRPRLRRLYGVDLIVAAVGRSEGFEAFLRLSAAVDLSARAARGLPGEPAPAHSGVRRPAPAAVRSAAEALEASSLQPPDG